VDKCKHAGIRLVRGGPKADTVVFYCPDCDREFTYKDLDEEEDGKTEHS
jgi:predicted RNA-binding Zn-ribbon protein involved in translation (DUF1610 family)